MGDVSTAPVTDLHALVHSHCLFFDKLVELVPAKFYIASEGPSDAWVHGMSKAARATARQVSKENLKKARRSRLDPEKFTTTLQLLQKQEKEETPAAPPTGGEEAGKRAVTYEELRERLHKRIELLRAKRHADAAAATAKTARTWQTEKKKDAQKRTLKNKEAPSEVEAPPAKRPKHHADTTPRLQKEAEKAGTQLEFSRVKMGVDPMAATGRPARRKESKEQLLAKATALQAEIQDPQKGQDVAVKHSWSAAVSRAAGEKVLDNPKLLKRSLKKDQQQRQKSSKKWQERKELEKKAGQAKQQTRKEHITERQEAKKERQIAKREKKLMRPGFEGRKEGFINK